MGTYLSIGRLPIDPGVDLLTNRRNWDYLEFERPEYYQPSFYIFEPKHGPPKSQPNPRWLYLSKAYPAAFEMLTGTSRNLHSSTHFLDPPDDPRAHAIYGARKAGWRQDFPWRYSLPTDIEAILEALALMHDEDLLRNLQTAYEGRSADGSTPDIEITSDRTLASRIEGFESHFRGRFLSTLRRFYENAQAEGEIVLYDLG